MDTPGLRASKVVAGAPEPVRIAGVAYPAGAESGHTLVLGSGSADRRAVLLDLVEQLRSCGER